MLCSHIVPIYKQKSSRSVWWKNIKHLWKQQANYVVGRSIWKQRLSNIRISIYERQRNNPRGNIRRKTTKLTRNNNIRVNNGTWPGGQPSWGKSRIALEASTSTNTYGRGGFYVHGGWTAGSNGCIDLTENMADFTQWLKKHGQDLIVKVSYRWWVS